MAPSQPGTRRASSHRGDALRRETRSAGNIGRDHEDLLRRLALNDEHAIAALLGVGSAAAPGDCGPADRARAQIRLAALVAMQASPASYQWAVSSALAAGVTELEIVDVLCTIAPVTGAARVHSAAMALAEVLGCDDEDASRT